MGAEPIPTRHEPSTLSPRKAARIIAHVREGQYPGVAALLEGVAKRTWHQWTAWGQEELDCDLPPEDGTLAQLVERVDQARAESKAHHVKIVTDAGEGGSWQASMTWLERNFPDEYGRNQRVEIHTSRDESPADTVRALALEVRAMILRAGAEAMELEAQRQELEVEAPVRRELPPPNRED